MSLQTDSQSDQLRHERDQLAARVAELEAAHAGDRHASVEVETTAVLELRSEITHLNDQNAGLRTELEQLRTESSATADKEIVRERDELRMQLLDSQQAWEKQVHELQATITQLQQKGGDAGDLKFKCVELEGSNKLLATKV